MVQCSCYNGCGGVCHLAVRRQLMLLDMYCLLSHDAGNVVVAMGAGTTVLVQTAMAT